MRPEGSRSADASRLERMKDCAADIFLPGWGNSRGQDRLSLPERAKLRVRLLLAALARVNAPIEKSAFHGVARERKRCMEVLARGRVPSAAKLELA